MLIFDLDGTLIDSNGLWHDVDVAFLARRGMPYTEAYYQGVAHTVLREAAIFTKRYCGIDDPCEEIIAEWMELAKDAYSHVKEKPFIRSFLQVCKDRSEKCCIVTSCVKEHCESALASLGLDTYFSFVIYAAETGLNKNEPEIWRLAAETSGVLPEACTVFDDSWRALRAAGSAGMQTVGVYDAFGARELSQLIANSDRFIRSFAELL